MHFMHPNEGLATNTCMTVVLGKGKWAVALKCLIWLCYRTQRLLVYTVT